MSEIEPPPHQSDAATSGKFSNVTFSIWPPSERTRDAVRNRLIETLSSPSILSNRYGTVSRDEAIESAKIIEEEAFEEAGKAATSPDEGIEILQIYSKEISKMTLDKVKGRSDETPVPSASTVTDEPNMAAEEDAGSTAPPQSEKTESFADDE